MPGATTHDPTAILQARRGLCTRIPCPVNIQLRSQVEKFPDLIRAVVCHHPRAIPDAGPRVPSPGGTVSMKRQWTGDRSASFDDPRIDR